MSRRIRKWFVEGLDDHTNQVIAVEFDKQIELHKAEHGKIRKVFPVSHSELEFLKRSVTHANLKYVVWACFDREPLKRSKKSSKKESAINIVRNTLQKFKTKQKIDPVLLT